MKILVVSDSHGHLDLMRQAIRAVKPDAVVHLGDYYEDGAALAEENPELRFHIVAGNCDLYRLAANPAQTLCYPVCGVKLYMTHGHLHHVKYSLAELLQDGRRNGVQAVLYGHTHMADCHQEADGLWVVNPGTCGYFGSTVAVMDVADGQIRDCIILTKNDLSEMQKNG